MALKAPKGENRGGGQHSPAKTWEGKHPQSQAKALGKYTSNDVGMGDENSPVSNTAGARSSSHKYGSKIRYSGAEAGYHGSAKMRRAEEKSPRRLKDK